MESKKIKRSSSEDALSESSSTPSSPWSAIKNAPSSSSKEKYSYDLKSIVCEIEEKLKHVAWSADVTVKGVAFDVTPAALRQTHIAASRHALKIINIAQGIASINQKQYITENEVRRAMELQEQEIDSFVTLQNCDT